MVVDSICMKVQIDIFFMKTDVMIFDILFLHIIVSNSKENAQTNMLNVSF